MRIRVTTHLYTGERIGLTIWFGSIAKGWMGIQPFHWSRQWRITSVPEAEPSGSAE
jgi:hypothetical protein